MKAQSKKNKVYAAGITTRDGNWAWQGTVVASTLKEAKELLSKYKKDNKIVGTAVVDAYFGTDNYTQRKKGVSSSMNLFSDGGITGNNSTWWL